MLFPCPEPLPFTQASDKETQYFPLSQSPTYPINESLFFQFSACIQRLPVVLWTRALDRIHNNIQSYWELRRIRDRLIFLQTSKPILNRYPREIRFPLNLRIMHWCLVAHKKGRIQGGAVEKGLGLINIILVYGGTAPKFYMFYKGGWLPCPPRGTYK